MTTLSPAAKPAVVKSDHAIVYAVSSSPVVVVTLCWVSLTLLKWTSAAMGYTHHLGIREPART